MSTWKFEDIVKKIFPKNSKPCKGHQLKYYFQDMHGKHIDECENIGGCSHDCRICKKVRYSRWCHERQLEDNMVRCLTRKLDKHNQEFRRARIEERMKQAEEKRLGIMREEVKEPREVVKRTERRGGPGEDRVIWLPEDPEQSD